MLVAPVTKTFQKMLKSNLIFVPIGLAYLFLLVQAWSPDSLSLLFPGDLATAVATGATQPFGRWRTCLVSLPLLLTHAVHVTQPATSR
jgi:hypothetical protein